MKKNKFLCFGFLMTLLVAVSCKIDSNKELELKKQFAEVENKETGSIKNEKVELVDLYQTRNIANSEKVVFYSNKEFNDKNFILISKFKTDKNKEVLIKQDTLISTDEFSISVEQKDFEKKIINGKEFIFFTVEESPMGQFSMETILDFYIVDVAELVCYKSKFTGSHTLRSGEERLEGSFIMNDSLRNNSEIKKLMLDFIGKNKLIYKPSKKEEDIFYYKNYAKKWLDDNKLKDVMANGFLEIPNKIYSTYYKENIIEFTGEISDYDVVIENSNYKIVSFMRSNVIAYDKIKKLYFPIFIESCITGCNKGVKFIAKDKIRITHNEYIGSAYNPKENPDTNVINLSNIVFKS